MLFQRYSTSVETASHDAATFGSQINGKITVLSHFRLVANFGLRKHSVVSGDHCHLCNVVFREHLFVIVAVEPFNPQPKAESPWFNAIQYDWSLSVLDAIDRADAGSSLIFDHG